MPLFFCGTVPHVHRYQVPVHFVPGYKKKQNINIENTKTKTNAKKFKQRAVIFTPVRDSVR